MTSELLEPKLYKEAPAVCSKPGCGGTVFLPHKDGWQCFNRMKIIYKASDGPQKISAIERHALDKKKLNL